MTGDDSAKPDPGIAPHGNFINYYQFNSAEDRLQLLPTPCDAAADDNFWSLAIETQAVDNTTTIASSPYIVLDVGCNAGNFTQLLYGSFLRQHLPAECTIHILGIDIDAALIERANALNQYPANVTYACLDIQSPAAIAQLNDYLRSITVGGRPDARFNACFCLSLTMWIHLNGGDAGLARFLDNVAALSRLLVIEPQPWKCYGTAMRRQKRAPTGGRPFARFAELQWRQDVEERIDERLRGQGGRQRVWQTVPTKWQRRISLYMPATGAE